MLIDLDCIHTKFQEACQILELNSPKLEFEDENCSRYEYLDNKIVINLEQYIELKTKLLPFIKIKLSNDNDIIMFCLYHELGHCFQYQKFSRWRSNYITEYQNFGFNNIALNNSRKYRELKLEKNADKIACILFEKLERINR